jgi:hypothetical protein
MVYCSTLNVLGVVEIGVGRRRQRRGDARLQSGTGLGQRLADADGETLPVRTGAIAQPRVQRLLEFTLQVALLDDRLQRDGKILDAHGGSSWLRRPARASRQAGWWWTAESGKRQARRSSSVRPACHSS